MKGMPGLELWRESSNKIALIFLWNLSGKTGYVKWGFIENLNSEKYPQKPPCLKMRIKSGKSYSLRYCLKTKFNNNVPLS